MDQKLKRRELLSWARINFCWENWDECKSALNEFVSSLKNNEKIMEKLAKGMEEIDNWWFGERKKLIDESKKEGWAGWNISDEIQFTSINIAALHRFLILCESIAEKNNLV